MPRTTRACDGDGNGSSGGASVRDDVRGNHAPGSVGAYHVDVTACTAQSDKRLERVKGFFDLLPLLHINQPIQAVSRSSDSEET